MQNETWKRCWEGLWVGVCPPGQGVCPWMHAPSVCQQPETVPCVPHIAPPGVVQDRAQRRRKMLCSAWGNWSFNHKQNAGARCSHACCYCTSCWLRFYEICWSISTFWIVGKKKKKNSNSSQIEPFLLKKKKWNRSIGEKIKVAVMLIFIFWNRAVEGWGAGTNISPVLESWFKLL